MEKVKSSGAIKPNVNVEAEYPYSLVWLYEKTKSDANYLMGRILTVVDATYTTPTQNKAIKDVIKPFFWEFSNGVDKDFNSLKDYEEGKAGTRSHKLSYPDMEPMVV